MTICKHSDCDLLILVGGDAHDVFVNGELHFYCAPHCPAPQCNGEEEEEGEDEW